jgi:predicted CoA-binding protein
MSQEVIKNLLSHAKVLAIVSLSQDPFKASYHVSSYLQQHGYHIIPVNPFADTILGQKSYKTLLDIPKALQKQLILSMFSGPQKMFQP